MLSAGSVAKWRHHELFSLRHGHRSRKVWRLWTRSLDTNGLEAIFELDCKTIIDCVNDITNAACPWEIVATVEDI